MSRTTGRWGRAERLRELYWMLGAMGTSGLLSIIPVLFDRRFYWADDTQAGAYPIWVKIGQYLREGTLPFFAPSQWMSGNYVAEGQWGTFNPIIWLTGWIAAGVDNGLIFTTVLKLLWIALAAGGFFLLARSYGASRTWAYAAGVLAPMSGFSTYVHSTSWVTSLFVWALLPWAWWGLHRVLTRGANPLVAFVPAFVLITIGYVHGTIMLIFAICGVLLEGVLLRRWAGTVRALVVSCAMGLVALAVYLPGVLTAPVTTRFDQVLNTNFMSPDLSGLATAAIPTAMPWLTGFWETPASAPLMYIAWLLPLVVLVRWRAALPVLRSCGGLLVMLLASTVLTFGPSDLGPLRFPARLYPYVAAMILVLLAVLLSKAAHTPGKVHTRAVVIISVAGFVLAWAEAPFAWRSVAVGAVLSGGGTVALLVLIRRGLHRRIVGTIAAVTVVVTVAQHWWMPAPILPDFGLPARQSQYQGVLADVPGQTIVVGNPLGADVAEGEEWWRSTLYANAWYLTDAPVMNTYSAIAHEAFNADLCMDAHGVVCWETAERLFSEDRTTGLPLVDLLALDAVQVLSRASDAPTEAGDPWTYMDVPEGWHEVRRNETYALWVRDEPLVQGAGGIVWTSEGVAVSDVEVSDREVTFRLDAVPADGGQITFSRLNWPGYEFTNATQGRSLRGYLLTADVAAGSAGQVVTVRFTPPGFGIGLVSVGVGVLGTLGWSLAAVVADRRRRDAATVDEAVAPAVPAPGK